jgi:hypothetical protein
VPADASFLALHPAGLDSNNPLMQSATKRVLAAVAVTAALWLAVAWALAEPSIRG